MTGILSRVKAARVKQNAERVITTVIFGMEGVLIGSEPLWQGMEIERDTLMACVFSAM